MSHAFFPKDSAFLSKNSAFPMCVPLPSCALCELRGGRLGAGGEGVHQASIRPIQSAGSLRTGKAKGGDLAKTAVETQSKRRCLGHEGSGNTRQKATKQKAVS